MPLSPPPNMVSFLLNYLSFNVAKAIIANRIPNNPESGGNLGFRDVLLLIVVMQRRHQEDSSSFTVFLLVYLK